MQPPPLPANEAERLVALSRYRIVDTDFEAAYDELAELAAFICGTPIALITLITSDRQWFKARVGLELRETARELAFCAHTILQREVFIVNDARRDARFADNPLVQSDPHIRFYAGAPLVTPDGFALGSLCAIDRVPRRLSAEQERALRIVAHQVMTQLILRLTLAEQERISAQLALLNASKDLFFSLLSHDLRSPFSGIMGFSELLQDDLEKLSLPEIRDYVGHIQSSADQALRLIDNLLQWSMFETGAMRAQPQRLQIDELAGEVLALFAATAAQKQIQLVLRHNEAASAYADRDMVQTVLRNLVANAIKYTPPEGTVTLSSEVKEGWVEVSVTDNGTGMRGEQLERLFERNLRTSTRGTAGEQGMGLGLMLCREFVEKCGGRIWARSQPGQGATFTFSLPREEATSDER